MVLGSAGAAAADSHATDAHALPPTAANASSVFLPQWQTMLQLAVEGDKGVLDEEGATGGGQLRPMQVRSVASEDG